MQVEAPSTSVPIVGIVGVGESPRLSRRSHLHNVSGRCLAGNDHSNALFNYPFRSFPGLGLCQYPCKDVPREYVNVSFGDMITSVIPITFTEYLAESDFIEDLDHIVRCFDKTTKIRFSNASQVQYVKFGSTRDNDPSCNVRFGQLKLSGEDVATFFESSVKCVINAVKEQKKMSHKPISVRNRLFLQRCHY